MPATFSMKKLTIPKEVFSRIGGIAKDAVGGYFSEAMPTTTSIFHDTQSIASTVNREASKIKQQIVPQIRNMKLQTGMKMVFNWFMGEEASYDIGGDDLQFDSSIASDSSEPASSINMELSGMDHVADKVSKTVVATNQHMLEGQMQLTANIVATLNNQTTMISSGLQSLNDSVNKLLEVVTKNTATMIEVEKVVAQKESPLDSMLRDRRFSLRNYVDSVKNNAKNASFGMLSLALDFLQDPAGLKTLLTPETIASFAFTGLMDKAAPNLKKNLKALDEAVNDTIMHSLIRLGENKSNPLARIFGISAERNEFQRNRRSSVELKSVPFDMVTKEAITQTIPGYLRRILVQLGGEDLLYDNRARAFRKQRSIQKDFTAHAASNGTLYSASGRVRNAFGSDEFARMLYDMIMTDMSDRYSTYDYNKKQSQSRTIIDSFRDKRSFKKYANSLYDARGNADALRRIDEIAERLSKDVRAQLDISSQIAQENVHRNKRTSSYLKEADAYGIDVTQLTTSVGQEMEEILSRHGIEGPKEKRKKSRASMSAGMVGTDYTHAGIYEIYRLLDRGINVFQVGSSTAQTTPYPKLAQLAPPPGYRAKNIRPVVKSNRELGISNNPYMDNDNPLRDEEGTAADRLGKWGSKRGNQLMKAIVNGSPQEIKEIFSASIADITEVFGDKIKEGMGKINDSFGNVTGYLRHKFFGSAYSYKDGNGEMVDIKENEKGGIFGVAKEYIGAKFNNIKETTSKWFQGVSSYFSDTPGEDKKVASKRKKLIAASVGAMAGGGILGGPIGLMMGAMAGSALSSMDMGDKIKKFLIGRDEKGRPTGIITKSLDKLIDPLRYQFQKTAHVVGNVFKEKVLGPIADIGIALKERIVSFADSTFGKFFRAIGKILMLPLTIKRFATRVAGEAAGTGVRGATRAAGGVADFTLSGFANMLAGDTKKRVYNAETDEWEEVSVRDQLKERQKSRRKSYHDNDTFDDYKTWKEKENQRRKQLLDDLKEAMADIRLTPEEKARINKEDEDRSTIKDDVSKLTEEATKEGSLYTHDIHLESLVENIVDILSGKKPSKLGNGVGSGLTGEPMHEFVNPETGEKMSIPVTEYMNIHQQVNEKYGITSDSYDWRNDKRNYIVDGATGAKISAEEYGLQQNEARDSAANKEGFANTLFLASQSAANEGNLTAEDQRQLLSQAKEAAKPNSSNEKQLSTYSSILHGQEEDIKAEQEQKTSLFDMLKDFLPSALATLKELLPGLGILTGLGLLINSLGGTAETIKTVLGNIWDTIGRIFKYLNPEETDSDPSTSDDTVTSGVNAALTVGGVKVKHFTGLMPGGLLYNIDNTAAGDPIVAQSASRDKFNLQILQPFQKSNLAHAKYYDATRRLAAIDTQLASGGVELSDELKKSLTAEQKALQEATKTKPKSAINSITRSGAKVLVNAGLSAGAGVLAGAASKKIAAQFTDDEAIQEKISASTTSLTTMLTSAGLTRRSMIAAAKGKNTATDVVVDWIGKMFSWLIEKIPGVKALKPIAGRLVTRLKELWAATVGKVTKAIADKIIAGIAKITGKEAADITATGLTFGLSIIIGGLSGVIDGLCGTEHLFDIPPSKADGLMKLISSILNGVLSAAEWTPGVGFFVSLIRLVDDTIVNNFFDTTILRQVAIMAYGLLGGDSAKLEQLQEMQNEDRKRYEEKFGAEISATAYNDLINSGGWFDRALRGGPVLDENGRVDLDKTYDDAGNRRFGGISGAFLGDYTYMRDQSGSILTGADGEAIKVIDKYGRQIKEVTKLGDTVGAVAGNVLGFFTGRDIYETDSNGQAVIDPITGSYKIAGKEKNIFGKIGDAFSAIIDGIGPFGRRIEYANQNMFKATLNGDIPGLFRSAVSTDQNGNLAILETILNGIVALSDLPMAGFNLVVKGAQQLFGWIGSAANNSANVLGRSLSQLDEYTQAGDIGGLWGSEFQMESGDNPVGVVGNIAFFTEKLLHTPVAAINAVGNAVSPFFEEVGRNTVITLNASDKANSDVNKYANNSDVASMWGVKIDHPSGFNPMGIVAEGTMLFTKIFRSPGAILGAIGKAITAYFTNVGKNTIISQARLDQSKTTVASLSKDGKISEMWKTRLDIPNLLENPLNPVFNAGLVVTKIWHTPGALIHSIGSAINDWFNNTTSSIDADKKALDNAGKMLDQAAANGDISKVMSAKVTLSKDDPVSGIFGAGFFINKIFHLVGAIANSVVGGIGDFFSGIWDGTIGKLTGSGGPTNGVGGVESERYVPNAYGSGGPNGPLSKSFNVTSDYGKRTYPYSGVHKGVDLAPADGSGKANVLSQYEGTVSYVKNNVPNTDTAYRNRRGDWQYSGSNSGGNEVWIDTPAGIRIKNMHLKAGSIPKGMKRGTKVSIGSKIGEVGSTGWSTGQHLHYQVEANGKPINPMNILGNVRYGHGGVGGDLDYISELQHEFDLNGTRITQAKLFNGSNSSEIISEASKRRREIARELNSDYSYNAYTKKFNDGTDISTHKASEPIKNTETVTNSNSSSHRGSHGSLNTNYDKASKLHEIYWNNWRITQDKTKSYADKINATENLKRVEAELNKLGYNTLLDPINTKTTSKTTASSTGFQVYMPGIGYVNPDTLANVTSSKSGTKSSISTASSTAVSRDALLHGSGEIGDLQVAKEYTAANPDLTVSESDIYGYNQMYLNSSDSVDYTSSSDYSSLSETQQEDLGPLGNLLRKLRELGSNFLFNLTGGLFGKESSSSSSSSSSSAISSSSVATNISDAGLAKLLMVAAGELGTKDDTPGSQTNKYNRWYYGSDTKGPWCMAFVQWCFDQAGMPLEHRTAGCKDLESWFKSHHPDRVISGSELPQPGDIMIQYNSNGSGHTGIVESVDGNTIHTIEGNTWTSSQNDACVARRNYQKSSGRVVHWLRPYDYATSSESVASFNGQSITLPDGGVEKTFPSNIGYSMPVMGWQLITSPSSNQYKLRQAAGQRFDANGYAMIDGRYGIAMKPYFGNVGDYMDITLENGQQIPAIIADIKGTENENQGISWAKYAHGTTEQGSSVIEFVVDKNTWYPLNTTKKWSGTYYHPEWKSRVAKVVNRGNYWTVHGSGGSESSFDVPFMYDTNSQDLANIDISTLPDLPLQPGVSGYNSSFGVTNAGVGGSNDAKSTLVNSKYVKQPTRTSVATGTTRKSYKVGESTRPKTTYRPSTITVTPSSTGSSSSSDLGGVILLLNEVVQQLASIDGNTASSTNYLEELNGKEFVDTGLRDSINKLVSASKSKPKKSATKSATSKSNAKTIAKIARA